MTTYDLSRFTKKHEQDFQRALTEIKSGEKRTHWMWYIFPQICGLGHSFENLYYSIKSIEEAKAFLNDEYLGSNLLEICNALLELDSNDAIEIFGNIDALKLCSSMTLFECAAKENPIFEKVLNKYFNGIRDEKTLVILGLY